MPGSAVSAIGCVQRESSRCPTPTGPTGASIRQAAHAVCSCLGWAMEPCSAIRTRTELGCTRQARQASEKGWERRSDEGEAQRLQRLQRSQRVLGGTVRFGGPFVFTVLL